MSLPFFTIGHSTHGIETLAAMLKAADVTRLVDIRTIPKSRTNPQFNEDTIAHRLAPHGIAYTRIAALGGLRKKSKDVAADVNGFWENRSFHNYADYALSDAFRAALDELVALGRETRCAVMCSEAVWWRCHRRIVADYLLARGETVCHLMGEGKTEAAQLTRGARVVSAGKVVYPAAA
jgi:uncharacterized protein (DUF488 family)